MNVIRILNRNVKCKLLPQICTETHTERHRHMHLCPFNSHCMRIGWGIPIRLDKIQFSFVPFSHNLFPCTPFFAYVFQRKWKIVTKRSDMATGGGFGENKNRLDEKFRYGQYDSPLKLNFSLPYLPARSIVRLWQSNFKFNSKKKSVFFFDFRWWRSIQPFGLWTWWGNTLDMLSICCQ